MALTAKREAEIRSDLELADRADVSEVDVDSLRGALVALDETRAKLVAITPPARAVAFAMVEAELRDIPNFDCLVMREAGRWTAQSVTEECCYGDTCNSLIEAVDALKASDPLKAAQAADEHIGASERKGSGDGDE